jgi:hypothetical protein
VKLVLGSANNAASQAFRDNLAAPATLVADIKDHSATRALGDDEKSGATRYAAGQAKIDMPKDATVAAHVSIGPRDDCQGFGLVVTMDVSLPGMTKAAADDLAARGHVVCPYSHSIHGNVVVITNTHI